MSHLRKVLVVLIALALIGSILGLVGVIGPPWRAYCFLTAPALLLVFACLKPESDQDKDSSQDTPWGL
jgi:hypothetical protein